MMHVLQNLRKDAGKDSVPSAYPGISRGIIVPELFSLLGEIVRIFLIRGRVRSAGRRLSVLQPGKP